MSCAGASLGEVKAEFEKFGAVLNKRREKIEPAGKELEKAGTRTNAINRAPRPAASD